MLDYDSCQDTIYTEINSKNSATKYLILSKVKENKDLLTFHSGQFLRYGISFPQGNKALRVTIPLHKH